MQYCPSSCDQYLRQFQSALQAELVVLGGAFNCNGNVNPAAEANIFGDPDAADFVYGCPMRCGPTFMWIVA